MRRRGCRTRGSRRLWGYMSRLDLWYSKAWRLGAWWRQRQWHLLSPMFQATRFHWRLMWHNFGRYIQSNCPTRCIMVRQQCKNECEEYSLHDHHCRQSIWTVNICTLLVLNKTLTPQWSNIYLSFPKQLEQLQLLQHQLRHWVEGWSLASVILHRHLHRSCRLRLSSALCEASREPLLNQEHQEQVAAELSLTSGTPFWWSIIDVGRRSWRCSFYFMETFV